MNNARWAVGIGALLLMGSAAWAQLPKTRIERAPLPPAPLVRPVPEGMGWTLNAVPMADLQDGDEKEKGKDEGAMKPKPRKTGFELQRADGAFAEGLCRVTLRYTNHATRSFYRVGQYEIFTHPQTGRIRAFIPVNDPGEGGVCDAKGLFPEFGWVAAKYHIGSAVYQKRRCHVYRQYTRRTEAARETDDETVVRPAYSAQESRAFAPEAQWLRTAYIDAASGLPVALEHQGGIWSYQYRMEKDPVTLPPEYRQALENATEGSARLQKKYQIPQ